LGVHVEAHFGCEAHELVMVGDRCVCVYMFVCVLCACECKGVRVCVCECGRLYMMYVCVCFRMRACMCAYMSMCVSSIELHSLHHITNLRLAQEAGHIF
jgi:hypothetical protein